MKISDLPVLADAKGNAYIPVVDPDETNPALQNKRIYLSTIAASVENFEPYDPAKTYSKAAPDYVSYNSNVYEYIGLTPSVGNTPSNTIYWKPTSAGQFSHIQNTDTSTNSRAFEIGRASLTQLNMDGFPVAEPTGSVVMVFGRANDNSTRTAIREYWETEPSGDRNYYLQFCLSYTGTGSDVWVDFGTGTGGGGTHPTEIELTGTTPTWNVTDYKFAFLTASADTDVSLTLANAEAGILRFTQDATTGGFMLRVDGDLYDVNPAPNSRTIVEVCRMGGENTVLTRYAATATPPTPITPAAPTAMIVDDTAKTFDFTEAIK